VKTKTRAKTVKTMSELEEERRLAAEAKAKANKKKYKPRRSSKKTSQKKVRK